MALRKRKPGKFNNLQITRKLSIYKQNYLITQNEQEYKRILSKYISK